MVFDGMFLQIGDTLEEFLVQATSDQKLRQVMMSLSEAIRTIAFKVLLLLKSCIAIATDFGSTRKAFSEVSSTPLSGLLALEKTASSFKRKMASACKQ